MATGASATFDTKHAGTGKTLTGSGFTLAGAQAWRYTITSAAGTGSISRAPLDFSAVSDSKGYDGTTGSSATPTVGDGQVQTGDSVTGLAQDFDSRNAGARTLAVSTYSINDGNGGNNYDLTLHDASGSISQAAVTVTATTNTKVADGGTSAVATPTVTSGTVFPGDDTTGSFTETYADAAAGYPKTLNPAGVVHDGNGGLNYLYTYVPDTTGRIRPGPVASLTFTAQPIDTKTGTPIYDTCVAGGSPCAASSAPVQVTARDLYLNLAGPGAPGADGTTAAIFVVIQKDNWAGATLGPLGGTQTFNGVASSATRSPSRAASPGPPASLPSRRDRRRHRQRAPASRSSMTCSPAPASPAATWP